MNIRLPFRLVAVTAATGLMLAACGGSGGASQATRSPSAASGTTPGPSASASAPAPPATATPTPPGTRPPSTPAPSGDGRLGGSEGLQPLWPFATLDQARAWEREYRSGGHQPWHLDPAQTALSFTQGFLGFKDIDRVTTRSVGTSEARIGVGGSGPEAGATAAVIHLVRYGSGPNAPWEVVGTDDTTFSLTTPAYGSVARSPVRAGGRITGVDETIHVQVHQPSSTSPLGSSCCVSAGGKDSPWSASVSFTGARDPVLTLVASTGGHVAEVERFAVTALRTR
ncbi:hypothetical protein ABZ070_25670 [Streptomyces sp. NPDC006283]|uniref:hypothetical protein n=1 Tax=Streptomyces sp. NPDC006283 TaxID=3156741 RepID=UPI0033B90541